MKSVSLILIGLLSAALPAAHAADDAAIVYDIPRLNDIMVDGKAQDWGHNGFRIDLLTPVRQKLKPAGDHDVRARLAWNARGLLVLASVADDTWVEHPDKDKLWMYDALQLFLAPRRGASNMCQWVIAPGMDPKQPELRWNLHDYRKGEALRAKPAAIKAARSFTDAGCHVEVLLPWSSLDIEPVEGREIGFQLYVADADSRTEQQVYNVAWFPALSTFRYTERLQRLRLSRGAGSWPAIMALVTPDPKTWRKQVLVITGPKHEGQTAALVESKGDSPQPKARILAKARIAKDESGRPAARLLPPKNMVLRPDTRIELTIDGKVVTDDQIIGKESYSSVSGIDLRWVWDHERSLSPPSFSVSGSLYETEIPPGGKAKYRSARYHCWVPAKAKVLRGIIVHQHGCEGNGITVPYDVHWQALAAKWDCMLMGTHYTHNDDCSDWSNPDNGSALAFLSAIQTLADRSGHPELVHAPWVLWGHSDGAHWTTAMLDKYPERIAAAFPRSGGGGAKSDGSLKVPVLYSMGVQEQSDSPDLWKKVLAAVSDGRARGALVSLAIDPRTGRECGHSRLLAIPFFDACLAQRLPPPTAGPVTLKPMDQSTAWLGNTEDHSIAPASKYQGNPRRASWLPDEQTARRWQEYVKTGWVPDTTPPVAPTNVIARVLGNHHVALSWDAAADLESGIKTFYIYRNGEKIEHYTGPQDDNGEGVFQYAGHGDEPLSDDIHKGPKPEQLPQMRFLDSDVRPNTKYTYRISTVNRCNLESHVSQPATDGADMPIPDEFPGIWSVWDGFNRYTFKVDGRECIVVTPKKAAPGKPWIWRARFFAHQPQVDLALLKKGFHLVYIDVAGMWGSDEAVAHWDTFYEFLTTRHGLGKKAALEGMSRGGMIIYNWGGRNPEKVSCIYGDAPCCNFKATRGFAEGEPYVDNKYLVETILRPLAKAGVRLIHVCGDADESVNVDEHTRVLEKRYKELGGTIKVIIKKGAGHWPHSLEDPTPIVDFILKSTPKSE